jgi:pimeloyl-ACP methyl ester carboxylesterase
MKKLLIGMMVMCASIYGANAQPKAIHIEKQGKGQPVLFLPGFITPGTVWNETFKNLKGKYEAHLVSYAGFNGLEPIPMPWYETIKKELVAYANDNKLKNIRLVGHSMGGGLALEIAAALGERVSAVVLVDALACFREVMMPGVPAASLQYESKYNQQMLQATDEAFAQTAGMMAQGMSVVPDKQQEIKSWIVQADRKTYVYGYTDLLKADARPLLASIQAPVLILGAPFPSKEAVLPNFEKQFADLKNKKIEIAPAGRHYIMFDEPQWFYNQLNTFFAK